MKIEASNRFARISPTKARPLARLLTGMPVPDALQATAFSRQKAAFLIGKVLKAAIANAENNAKQSAEEFRVERVIVEQGPMMRRHWSRSRGMARPVTKRTSHIRIILANE
ncbi:MAG: 50S ribosomal protein L22 [Kiritimatiellae bacterium]|nr:50S ribosomal protein L22 [Kiritimatiellia bacterium]